MKIEVKHLLPVYINMYINIFEQGYLAGIYNLLTNNHLNYDKELILPRVQREEGTQDDSWKG